MSVVKFRGCELAKWKKILTKVGNTDKQMVQPQYNLASLSSGWKNVKRIFGYWETSYCHIFNVFLKQKCKSNGGFTPYHQVEKIRWRNPFSCYMLTNMINSIIHHNLL